MTKSSILGKTEESLSAHHPRDETLDQVAFFVGRVYYTYIGLLDRILVEMELDQHLQPGMGNILFALFEQDDRRISEIGERLQVSRSTMTGMVHRMRKAGLITTCRDPKDRRATRLRLTSLGRSLEPRCRELAQQLNAVLCRRLTEAESGQIRTMLATMIDSMNEELEELNRVEDEL